MINLCFDAASQVCLRHRDLFQTRKLAAKECVPLDLCLVREVLRVTRRTLQDSTIVTTPVTPDSDPAASTSDPWGDGVGCPLRATKLKLAWLQRASQSQRRTGGLLESFARSSLQPLGENRSLPPHNRTGHVRWEKPGMDHPLLPGRLGSVSWAPESEKGNPPHKPELLPPQKWRMALYFGPGGSIRRDPSVDRTWE